VAKFNFNLRSPGKLTLCPIYLIIRYDNLKLVYPTQETIPPEHWNAINQRAKASRKFLEYPYFNERLNQIEGIAKTVFTKFLIEHENRRPSITELRNELNNEFLGKPAKRLDLFKFIEQFIHEAKTRANEHTGKLISVATRQIYERTLLLLRDYAASRHLSLDFDNIDLDFYFKFVEYLTKERSFSSNTIGKHVKTIKVFMNDATERGLNTKLSYKSKKFQIVSEDVQKVYLGEEELAEIFELDLREKPKLERVRDLFIVGCWTGLRFSDLSSLTEDNFHGDYIHVEMKKTRDRVVIPVHSTVRAIRSKYAGKTYNSLPPVISNAKTNAYLKEIMKLMPSLRTEIFLKRTKGGVESGTRFTKADLVTVHTARRSFATNLYLSKFPVVSIMKITGHQSEKTFLQYIKITPRENAELLMLHWEQKQGSTQSSLSA
jgi:integrase